MTTINDSTILAALYAQELTETAELRAAGNTMSSLITTATQGDRNIWRQLDDAANKLEAEAINAGYLNGYRAALKLQNKPQAITDDGSLLIAQICAEANTMDREKLELLLLCALKFTDKK